MSSLHQNGAPPSPNSPKSNVPRVKKPLNAFMLFMKEMRQKVIEECTLKESAAINQILGRRVSEKNFFYLIYMCVYVFFFFRFFSCSRLPPYTDKTNGHPENELPQDKKRPYVKKPLNAFMLFMKEMRQKVIEDCTLKESAAINQILGRKVSLYNSISVLLYILGLEFCLFEDLVEVWGGGILQFAVMKIAINWGTAKILFFFFVLISELYSV